MYNLTVACNSAQWSCIHNMTTACHYAQWPCMQNYMLVTLPTVVMLKVRNQAIMLISRWHHHDLWSFDVNSLQALIKQLCTQVHYSSETNVIACHCLHSGHACTRHTVQWSCMHASQCTVVMHRWFRSALWKCLPSNKHHSCLLHVVMEWSSRNLHKTTMHVSWKVRELDIRKKIKN